MKSINQLTSVICPLDRKNIDTDQIIPKQFLKRIERTGFGKYLFYHWRFNDYGERKVDFELNNPLYQQAEILVVNENFGCGSSREHAPWALSDYGFRVIIAPSFADIFYNNCMKNGLLAIRLEKEAVHDLLCYAKDKKSTMQVHLQEQMLILDNGTIYHFSIDPYYKEMLINGWDEIAITLQLEEHIRVHENKRIF